MTMPEAEGGGIFVSYRRQESKDFAGRLYDRLADRFGEGQVFIDVDAIGLGVDFGEEISRAVAACQVLLAVIGPTWLTTTDERGRRRLDDPDDLVRLEIEAALARGVQVIPILVEGAIMPGRDDLPESLASLARRNALFIRHESFRHDAGWLVAAIESVLVAAPGAVAVPGAPDARAARPIGRGISGVPQQGPGPTQSDLARAARLLADAEAIANSITDKESKAVALGVITGALAAINPNRAARVATDLERIANSLTDEQLKTWALSGVAKALAATDPDRAEAIANSLTDEQSKASALSGVAEALAAIDPDRAARLFTGAEAIANSLTDEQSKASALSEIAKALAATDPDRATRVATDAEAIANSLTDEISKAVALGVIAAALAAIDPDRAARVATDAERIANSLTNEESKAVALGVIAAALAAIDPDHAARVATDAEAIANSLTDESLKAVVLGSVANALAATDPDRAERIANSLTNEHARMPALCAIATALAATSFVGITSLEGG
jgi:hypothetical protein